MKTVKLTSRRRATTTFTCRAVNDDKNAAGEEEVTNPADAFNLDVVMDAIDRLAARYDWLSAGMGALLGTSYGVYRGQPPAQALGITVCATVVAVAIDELLKDQERKQR